MARGIPRSVQNDDLVAIHVKGLKLNSVDCSQLLSRGVEFAHYLGYKPDGVVKGSPAAHAMSLEAKRHGGFLPPMDGGGYSASFQSIGATSSIQPLPKANIRRSLSHANALCFRDDSDDNHGSDAGEVFVFSLPNYFVATMESDPVLVNCYKPDGYNVMMAETMLNNSILEVCRRIETPCEMHEGSKFRVLSMQRLENVKAFEKYKRYENKVLRLQGNQTSKRDDPPLCSNLPSWLKKLSRKNDLCASTNSVYLLHGTNENKLESIVNEGLQTSFSLSSKAFYGRGLYFSDKACKSSQYTSESEGCMLVCRVVLGRAEVLPRPCPNKMFASRGFDSAMAKAGVTDAPHGRHQLHNEYIVYNAAACYPEFVIRFKKE